ncbi:hypothetical protein [Methylobacterium nodulans]|uniref:Uncharacterized protein n=1 Tax=Methylobacterium nodulans (strain LMG 21967 / CNCM I-2342 / ORS 2060) TaxID=460265 RepID=B8IDG6_METNO|nr:hypothetical protein [Methylobacterium nodulans]ACL61332.1 conserved hypothetical protein [Methylobacterium nodulans ORS 2060]
MVQVTNRARGARLFWVRGEAAPRRLGPGESADLDLLDRDDPLLRAWEAAGEVVIADAPAPRRRPRMREV